MDKKGLVGWIILGVIFVMLLGLIISGGYFYNFHVFKTVRVCVGEGVDILYPCETNQECLDATGNTDIMLSLDGAPEFVRRVFQETLDAAIYCDGTCFVGAVRGIDPETQELEILESCEVAESEIVAEIRGREGLEVLNWMKNRG